MQVLTDLSLYRLTLIGAIVVLVLSVGVVTVLGGPTNAAPYLGLIGSVAIPALLGLFRLEQTAKQTTEQHIENTDKLDALAEALKKK